MTGRVRLRLRRAPDLPVDLRGILPAALCALQLAEIERAKVTQGRLSLALAEFFAITRDDAAAPELIFDGDLTRFDHVGCGMAEGRVIVDGTVGDGAGTGMSGGELLVMGNAGMQAACEMAGGRFTVQGHVGDCAAGPLPGSMDGMRGGTFIVRGNAGARFGDRMRRGSALVFGDAGDFVASRMVAGTLAIGGRCGAHPAYGMRRGSLVFAGHLPEIPRTFVPAGAPADVIWQLLARDLQQHGGPFAALASRRIDRHLGDLAAAGKGELILVG